MSWRITPTQPIPAVIGESFGGGYFAGYISHTADGNPTHALIVAPVSGGASGTNYPNTTTYAHKTSGTATVNTASDYDGKANTEAMVAAGIADHPAAQFCVGLSLGGFSDWYLPSRLELYIAYFNLKPSTAANTTAWGINPYAVPPIASNFTTNYPFQTGVSIFRSSSSEAFAIGTPHSSSTELFSINYAAVRFDDGLRFNYSKTSPAAVRAFRRIAL
jgi:hypothetical protein